jgi:ankyrin repeat protein
MRRQKVIAALCLMLYLALTLAGTCFVRKRLLERAMVSATRIEDVDTMMSLAGSWPSPVNARDQQGFTALHWAVLLGNTPLARKLLDHGADPNALSVSFAPDSFYPDFLRPSLVADLDNVSGRMTPVDLAFMCLRSEMVISLLKAGASGRSALKGYPGHVALALEWDCNTILRVLLERGAETDRKDARGNMPLHNAIMRRRHEAVEILLGAGADISLTNNDGETPLHLAIHEDSEELGIVLVTRGADVNARDKYGSTPVMCAASRGHATLMELLIQREADVKAADDFGNTALHGAETPAIAERLIAEGADVNVRGYGGFRPLHYALVHQARRRDVAKVLIAHGADVNAPDDKGNTPFHWACYANDPALVEFLVEKGGNVNVRADDGDAPLHWAAYAGDASVAAAIIARGAEVDAKNAQSETPLHYAARHGRKTVAALLLSKGADATARSTDGKTPLALALEEKPDDSSFKVPVDHKGVAGLLRKYGATE